MSRQTIALLGAGLAGGAGYLAGGSEHGQQYAGAGAGLGGAVAGLANAKFSRGDESEADHLGFDFYVRAGYHPDQFASFFRTLLEVEKASGGGQPEFLSDHPATADRVANAEKWSKEYKQQHPDWESRLKAPVADDAQFARIKQRSVEVAKSMPDEKALNTQKLVAALPRSCLWPDEPQPVSAKQAQQSLMEEAQKRDAAAAAKSGETPKK